jgi:hypothetical protein
MSKAAIKYSLNIKKYIKDQIVNTTYFHSFKSKEDLLNYIQKDKNKNNFMGVIKLRNFCFKLPKDSTRDCFLTYLTIEKKLGDTYFHSLKIFLLANSRKEIKLLQKNNNSTHKINI